jgi:hypothetical protein
VLSFGALPAAAAAAVVLLRNAEYHRLKVPQGLGALVLSNLSAVVVYAFLVWLCYHVRHACCMSTACAVCGRPYDAVLPVLRAVCCNIQEFSDYHSSKKLCQLFSVQVCNSPKRV